MNKRWVLLEHRTSKNSLNGIHFDLLLEEEHDCRTWRLEDVPISDGPAVKAVAIRPHNLYWLEKDEGEVSGGRGWAKRIYNGTFSGSLPLFQNDILTVEISGNDLKGTLQIVDSLCKINSKF